MSNVLMFPSKTKPAQRNGVIHAGLYEMSEREYRALPGLNWSTLKHVLDCPAKAKYLQENPVKQTPAMKIGSMVHMATLEADKFDQTYALRPEIEKVDFSYDRAGGGWVRYKTGSTEVEGPFKTKKEAQDSAPVYNFKGGEGYSKLAVAREERARYYSTFEFCSQEEIDTAWAVANSVYAHPASKELLDNSMREVVVVWYHKSSLSDEVFLCKAKIDAWDMSRNIICDLKTCQSSDPAVFTRNNIERWDLHAQLAWYRIGLRSAIEQELGADFDHIETSFIAVEKAPPHLVSYLIPSDDMMRIGEIQCQEAFDTWVKCETEDEWPARSEQPVYVDISPWKLKEFEDGLS